MYIVALGDGKESAVLATLGYHSYEWYPTRRGALVRDVKGAEAKSAKSRLRSRVVGAVSG